MNRIGKIGCESLNAFLDGEMVSGARIAFETHLGECSACAESVDEQQWIDALLRSPAAAELESAPKATMIAAVKRRQRRRVVLGMAVAAALAAVAAWLVLLPGREGIGEVRATVATTTTKPHSDAAVANPSPSPSLRGRAISEATFVSSSDAIAVPLESPAVNVTVVQVYPTVDAQRRLRLAAALSSISSEPNGG